jgi:hypothetical protein
LDERLRPATDLPSPHHAARFPLCGLTKLRRTGGRDESGGWTAERVTDTTHLLDGRRHADRLR